MIPSRRRSKEGVSDQWWVEEGYLLGWRGGVGLIHGSSHSAVAGVAVVPAVFGSGDREPALYYLSFVDRISLFDRGLL